GETASFLQLGAWRAGLEYLLAAGGFAGGGPQRALQGGVVGASRGGGPKKPTTPEAQQQRPMLYFQVRPGTAARPRAGLAASKIAVSLRSGRLRVSPGWWTDESDIDAFAQALERATK